MIKNRYILFILMFVSYLWFSCTDDYDKHYDRSDALPDEKLYDLIKENPDLSSFFRLVEIASYDSILFSNQTFTVWAPSNSALSGVNIESMDKEAARLIVENHVSRFNHSTTTKEEKVIRMRANKTYSFSDNGTFFAGSKIVQSDILAKNGILHILESQIPYYYNLYEYIVSTPSTSSLANFITRFDESIFDEEASIQIDIDDSGRPVYDTITVAYNRLFDTKYLNLGLGKINDEDSVYTMIVPTNVAWNEAYERIFPYFKLPAGEDSDSIQHLQTSLAVLEDLIYRGSIDNPASNEVLHSTSPSIISNPADLFAGTERIQASNGLIFQTDKLNYDNTETWNKPIIVESELTDGRQLSANTVVYTRTVDDNSEIEISEYQYIDVQGTTPTAQPGVTFDIPQVLSGKYNIYVEFIPNSLHGAPEDSTKVLFELTYRNANGGTNSEFLNSDNFVTSGTEKVLMKVFSNFEFPVSNYYDRLWWIDYVEGLHTLEDWVVTTKLMIRTNVSSSEFNNNIYKRRFCIDRIIFESVRDK